MLTLAAKFVPAADEVYRMQNLKTGTDPECRLFQKFAELGHYRRPGTTPFASHHDDQHNDQGRSARAT